MGMVKFDGRFYFVDDYYGDEEFCSFVDELAANVRDTRREIIRGAHGMKSACEELFAISEIIYSTFDKDEDEELILRAKELFDIADMAGDHYTEDSFTVLWDDIEYNMEEIESYLIYKYLYKVHG